ncbi:MAG: J domain-containing protein [Chloroflexota bacterium]|nr:J domain-containing protein [Chloroflexota bacterium]MDE2942331.1 J domain-containing protein [Chloroflexota bacterium]MDE3268264.1 J domain-containing protein [Chloroflexota bacterium]
MTASYYEILGVGKTATEKDIRQAYRRLARQYHPDVNAGDKASEQKFKEINEAYGVLSNADSRKKYDEFGDNWKHADQMGRGRPGQNAETFVWDFGGGQTGDIGASFFEDLLGGRGFGRTATASPRRTRLEQPVSISLEEAFRGTTRVIRLPAGAQGDGRRLEVTIPAGADNGSRIRVRPDEAGGDEVTLVVSVAHHPRFERRGADLHAKVDVPLLDAVLGGEVKVPTLTEPVILTIPPETQNGRSFRLAGKGMPRLGSPQSHGSLYASVQVIIPTKLSEKERELFRQLRNTQSTGE